MRYAGDQRQRPSVPCRLWRPVMATAPLDENEGEEGLLQTLPELLAAANCSHMLPTIQSSMHAPVTLEKCELWLKTGGVGLVMKFFRQSGLTDMALRTSVVKHLVEAHTTEHAVQIGTTFDWVSCAASARAR